MASRSRFVKRLETLERNLAHVKKVPFGMPGQWEYTDQEFQAAQAQHAAERRQYIDGLETKIQQTKAQLP